MTDNGPAATGAKRAWPMYVVLALPLIVVVLLIALGRPRRTGTKKLYCYVGGTMLPVMEELSRIYEEKTGIKVDLDKAGSGENYLKIKQIGEGDLNVAHAPYLVPLLGEGLAAQGWVVAGLQPVIVVSKGNPKDIRGLKDLTRDGIRLGVTHPKFSTLGHVLPTILKKSGMEEEIRANIEVEIRSGGEVANTVITGNLDAAIVWNAVGYLRRDALDIVPIEPEFMPRPGVDAVTSPTLGKMETHVVRVFICTLKGSQKAEAARDFAEFVDSEEGRAVFDRFGFTPSFVPSGQPLGTAAEGDRWLLIYCGAGLRHAVDDVRKAFTDKAGVVVQVDYRGSGQLLGHLKGAQDTGQLEGDLYMPGDIGYVERADALGIIESTHLVAYFVPVIMVREGNPKGIKSLTDLLDVDLAVGQKDACQVGKLTVKLFAKNGMTEEQLREATVTEQVTVNLVANKVKLGHADAGIVWDAVAGQPEYAAETDIVEIPLENNIISRVAVGVLKSSADKALAMRFVGFMRGEEGKAIFRANGYRVAEPE